MNRRSVAPGAIRGEDAAPTVVIITPTRVMFTMMRVAGFT